MIKTNEKQKGTYISADSCTSSAAGKNTSFFQRSKLFATIIFTNTKNPQKKIQKQRNPNSRPSPKKPTKASKFLRQTYICAAQTRWVLVGWSSPSLTSPLLSLLRRSKEGRERKKEAQAQGDVKANVFFNFSHSISLPLCFLLFLGDGIPYGSLGNNLKVNANEIRPGRQVGLGLKTGNLGSVYFEVSGFCIGGEG